MEREKEEEIAQKIGNIIDTSQINNNVRDKLYVIRKDAVKLISTRNNKVNFINKAKKYFTIKTIGGLIVAGAMGAYTFNYIYSDNAKNLSVKEKIQTYNYNGNQIEPSLSR